MKTCERCLLPIKNKADHGWYICPLEPRSGRGTNEPVAGSWYRSRDMEVNHHAKDVLQPFKNDGTVNKHFVQVHGTKMIEKETKMTAKEIHDNVERYG